MKIGIIGGNGFVGSGIRRTLERASHECTVISRANYESLIGQSFDVLINANGNSKKYLAASSPKEEFQASVTTVQHSLLDFKYNLFIHCSSVDVYANHEDVTQNTEETCIDVSRLSLYGVHKYLAELIVQKYAPQWLILRFGGFVGDGLKKNSIYDMLHNVPLRVHIDSKYQYFPTESAGETILSLLSKNARNEIYNVCGDGVISLREINTLIPEYTFSYVGNEPSPERYEVNINKINAIVPIPRTQDSVTAFVREFQQKPTQSEMD